MSLEKNRGNRFQLLIFYICIYIHTHTNTQRLLSRMHLKRELPVQNVV